MAILLLATTAFLLFELKIACRCIDSYEAFNEDLEDAFSSGKQEELWLTYEACRGCEQKAPLVNRFKWKIIWKFTEATSDWDESEKNNAPLLEWGKKIIIYVQRIFLRLFL